MKGSPKLPSCGFSAQAVQALVPPVANVLLYVDILQNPDIRAELPKYANWADSLPQLWVDGELVRAAAISSSKCTSAVNRSS